MVKDGININSLCGKTWNVKPQLEHISTCSQAIMLQ